MLGVIEVRLWIGCHLFIGDETALLLGASSVLAVRLLAAHFRWSLPKAKEFTEV